MHVHQKSQNLMHVHHTPPGSGFMMQVHHTHESIRFAVLR